MNLIVSVDALVPPLTGVGRYTWELVSRLRGQEGVDRLRFYRARRWVADPAHFASDPRVRERRSLLPRVLGDLYWRRALRGCVFHAPNFFLPPEAEGGVVTVHDLSVLKFPEIHPAERVRQYEHLFSASLQRAAHLITPSETMRSEVIADLSWPPERVTAVWNGVGPEFRPRAASEVATALRKLGLEPGRYVLCVSTIEPRKGIDALLDAFEQLPESLRASYPLVLAGDRGWRSEELHQRIGAAQAAGWLRYPGFVPEGALPMLYSGAQLFVYPPAYEGFGLPLAEAMACGVPVVAANRSCLPETAGGAARLVEVDDVSAFAAAIESGIGDEAWRQGAIADGIRVAARYSWDDCVDRTVSVYRSVAPQV